MAVDNEEQYVSGIALVGKCLSLIAMIAYGCAFLALVSTLVCLGLVISARKQAASKTTKTSRRVNARTRWNKVKDVGMKLKVKS